jgi:hypothetical protein
MGCRLGVGWHLCFLLLLRCFFSFLEEVNGIGVEVVLILSQMSGLVLVFERRGSYIPSVYRGYIYSCVLDLHS